MITRSKKARPPQKAPSKEARPLTPRQNRFVEHYLVHLNATRAAREAGYGTERAAQTGHDLRSLPKYRHVQAEIRRRQDAMKAENWHLQQLVREQLAHVLACDIGRLYKPGTREMKSMDELDPEDRAMIAEVTEKIFEGGRSLRVKLYNKLDAAKQLRKMLAMDRQPGPPEDDREAEMESARQSMREKLEELSARHVHLKPPSEGDQP